MEADTGVAQRTFVGKRSPLWITYTMVVLSVLYLIPEIIFNSQIAAVSGALSVTEDQIKSVGFFGRCMSGVGASLLVTDLILSWLNIQKIRGLLITLLLTTTVIWPLVFFGQKWAIDTFFVESSSPAVRKQAYLAEKFRGALAYNADKIEGIPISLPDELDRFDITFLSLFGVLALSEKSFFDNLEQDLETTVHNYMLIRAAHDFGEHYDDYVTICNEISELYREYEVLNKQYNERLSSAQKHSVSESSSQVKYNNLLWDGISSEMEIPLGPGLSWQSFQWNPEVQRKIFNALDPSIYITTIMADWNTYQFYENVIVPSVYRKEELSMHTLSLPESAYQNGGYQEEAAKDSLRAITVPPIAMGISLFLILMTILRIPIRLYELKHQADVISDGSNGTGVPISPGKKATPVNIAMFTVFIFCLPFTLQEGRFLSADTVSANLFLSAEKEYGWPVGMGLKWIMIMQPVFQPVGQVMEKELQVAALFVDYIDMFEDWDWYILDDGFVYD